MTDDLAADRDSRVVPGGSIPGAPGKPAFTTALREPAHLPVLIAVPHSGRCYPHELILQMRDHAAASIRLEDRYADVLAKAMARETSAGLLLAKAPRAMIDLNRDPDDVDWEMVAGGSPVLRHSAAGRRARSGLGLVPRRLPGRGELWKRPMSHRELSDRIEQVHKPYHAALADSLERLRDQWGSVLLIDLHSMPPLGPKQGSDGAPDFVIGDRFGAACDAHLAAAAIAHLSAAGRKVAHNRPYAGGYVLDRHAAPARGIHAIQVEICRSIYLDDELQEPGPGLGDVVRVLIGLVRRMVDELAESRGLSQAAE